MKQEKQQPEIISDAILLAYLADEVEPELRLRIEADEGLSARIRELAVWEEMLSLAYEEAECPTATELLLYQNQLLEEVQRGKIEQHLAKTTNCSCMAELAALAAIQQPASARPKENYLWELIKATGKQILDTVQIQEIQRPAMAFRGERPERRIIRAGDYMVVLMLTPPLTPDDYWQLEGQISRHGHVGPELEGKAQIYLERQVVAEDKVDEFGYFAMSEVPAGSLELLIETQQLILHPIGVLL